MIRGSRSIRVAFYTLLILLGLGRVPPSAWAGDAVAQLIRKTPGRPMAGLTWLSPWPSVEIETRWTETGPAVYAIMRGRFVRPDWNLISGSRKIQLNSKGEFKLLLPITAKNTRLRLASVGLKGEVERDSFVISFPTYDAYLVALRTGNGRGRFRVNPGLNFSFISYNDARVSAYSERAITAKLGMSYLLGAPRWSFEGGGYFTLVPLSHTATPSSFAADSARFLGVNLRVGYQVGSIPEPWGLSIQAGVYFTTMFVTNSDFGFLNMAGPQVFPVIRRTLSNGNSLGFYAKFSPVTTAVAGGFFDNRELATGGAYVIRFSNGHTLSFTLDVASLQLVFPTATVNSNSISLGFGYSLL